MATMMMRGISGDAHFFEESMNLERIRKLLDNKLGVAGHSEKLEAMKALLASISKGEDVSMFFADVVKNVIVASVEVKKLVYMYLVHYADANAQCRELALLSINSFQKDLADANPLIRALALRVMTSIRVRDILQIQLIAIRKCAADFSPYVRKCAANAISKIYAVDSEQQEVLAEIIGQLLNDSATMVLGSAVQALNEVCPDRLDLLHRPFRKICHLLADIDEWGQIVTINVLLRYCREQFQAPDVLSQDTERTTTDMKGLATKRKTRRTFYSDEENDDDDNEGGRDPSQALLSQQAGGTFQQSNPFHLGTTVPRGEVLPSIGSVFRSNAVASGIGGGEELDEDHRLLLRSSIPLLKSRNSGVVLAVATLHYYCGTHSVATNTLIGKSLVRIMRNQREIQYVVLNVISSMTALRPDMFRPFLQDFFVRATDPSYARKLKLDILTSLVTDANVSVILREFQAYVRHVDKSFVTMTVRALGRVANVMPSVAERCLSGLMHLVKSNHEQVVSESVIVIRHLLQQRAIEKDRMRVVRSLAAMMVSGRVTSASARASIVWMLGEFHTESDRGLICAAETLRLIVKSFADEATEMRLQVLTLAVKLALHAPQERNVQLLLQYIMELCKFDPDYDVRDRARLLRAVLSGDHTNVLNPHLIFASQKPAPLVAGDDESKGRFTLGTLASVVHHSVPGYTALPSWRTTAADPSVRDETASVEPVVDNREGPRKHSSKTDKKPKRDTKFYSSDESGSESASSSDSESMSGSDSGSDSDSGSSSGSASERESRNGRRKPRQRSESEYSSESESSSASDASSNEDDSDGSQASSDESEDDTRRRRGKHGGKRATAQKASTKTRTANLLDELNDVHPAQTANLLEDSGLLSAMPIQGGGDSLLGDLMGLSLQDAGPVAELMQHELLSKEDGEGLQVRYAFLRQPSMYSPSMNMVQLSISNHSSQAISNVQLMTENSDDSDRLIAFPEISVLPPGGVPTVVQIHVDFGGTLDSIPLQFETSETSFEVTLRPAAGELLVPHAMSLSDYDDAVAMAEQSSLHLADIFLPTPVQAGLLLNATLQVCNVVQVYEINNMTPTLAKLKFAGRVRGGNAAVVLIGIEAHVQSGKTKVLVITSHAAVADRLLTSIKRSLGA